MSGSFSQSSELLQALREYRSTLQQRAQALAHLQQTSDQMLSILRQDPMADITELLQRRELECLKLGELCRGGFAAERQLLEAAKLVDGNAGMSEGELALAAREVLSVQAHCEKLSQEVMAYQQECELILKTSLEVIDRAIRESKQRRKLDSVYGPACRHNTPIFLDRQQ